MFGPKVRISKDLYDQLRVIAEVKGYSSVDEYVTHVLETEVTREVKTGDDPRVEERLRGLGYI
jgi:hypothetical protein